MSIFRKVHQLNECGDRHITDSWRVTIINIAIIDKCPEMTNYKLHMRLKLTGATKHTVPSISDSLELLYCNLLYSSTFWSGNCQMLHVHLYMMVLVKMRKDTSSEINKQPKSGPLKRCLFVFKKYVQIHMFPYNLILSPNRNYYVVDNVPN